MKKVDIVLRELKSEIVTRKDLDSLAAKYKFNKTSLRIFLLNKGYLIAIFRGVYYLRSYKEKGFNTMKYSPYELLSKGLEIKGIKHWYFGLNSALKFLNLTHEVFPINFIINDKFNRVKPMKIVGTSFFFIKIKPSLFFGINKLKTGNGVILNYSDLEKTLLDLIYLKKKVDLEEYNLNKAILIKYLNKYDIATKRRVKENLKWK